MDFKKSRYSFSFLDTDILSTSINDVFPLPQKAANAEKKLPGRSAIKNKRTFISPFTFRLPSPGGSIDFPLIT
ncbi:hypothetical protein CEXT_397541 [Caerostris extrusa]|uniref:Uncharacterized protein n=1 Tax=Caerostris extrusa TaxID=172846 RepID=A0AAV4N4I3_CAEEX|nr:hypothetical protein CEXT_397541 [Caerostris extrusa]